MESNNLRPTVEVGPQETRKRRREIVSILILSFLFLVLTLIEFKLFEYTRSLPFVHSVFFFGLVNFNIILFLLLTFLIFRNVVKVFSEKQDGIIGSSLKAKLVAAFVSFSVVPTVLMFLISVFYINNSFDKWFSEKIASVLKSSFEVTKSYYSSAKKKNYHFAEQIANQVNSKWSEKKIKNELSQLRELYKLDSVEFYPDLLENRLVALSTDEAIPLVPPVSVEFLQKGIKKKLEASTIHHFGDGDLIRVIVPLKDPGQKGAIIVSTFVPLSLTSKMDAIMSAYDEFRDVNPLEYPLKSIYLVILVLMTLVILLCATWFGFYLAKQLSIPLQQLGLATRALAEGKYEKVSTKSGSAEISRLISNFNMMTSHLENSEAEVKEANAALKKAFNKLDEHTKYLEVILSNASTGVVSVDDNGVITMVNRHAAKLLQIESDEYVGRKAKDILTREYYHIFDDLLRTMKKHNAVSIQKEVRLNVNGRSMPLQMTLSVLYDGNKKEIGKVLVFDDLTPVLSAQRAAAWTEVARRIAHEIKNPLTPIKLSAQRLEKKFGQDIKDDAFTDCIHMIINQVDDLKSLVNEFSNFARLPKSNPVESNLNQIINESMILFEGAHKGIKFNVQLDEKLPNFKFDPDQLKRAITNLLNNSISALKGQKGPAIDVTTEFDSLLKIVRLSVVDNGSGISKSMKDRIFEPYMTTKEHGTGLGLAIVKRTVEDHNGFIRALSNKPKGTRFVIELPVIDATDSTKLINFDSMNSGETTV